MNQVLPFPDFKKNEKEEEELTIDINNYIVWFTQGY